MHKRRETNSTQRECEGSPCRRKAVWPSCLYRILNMTLSYLWHFHRTWQYQSTLEREETAQGEEPFHSPHNLLENGPGSYVSSALVNGAAADSSPAQIALSYCLFLRLRMTFGKMTAVSLLHPTGEPLHPSCNKETTVVICPPLLRTEPWLGL